MTGVLLAGYGERLEYYRRGDIRNCLSALADEEKTVDGIVQVPL